jgi:hypothetical protein
MSSFEWAGMDGEEPGEGSDAHDQEDSLHTWFFVAVWFAGGTAAALWWAAPAEAWYEWPLVWFAAVFITGIPLIGLFGLTVVVHGFWWKHLRGRTFRRRRLDRRMRGRASVAGDMLATLVIWGMIAAFLAILVWSGAEGLGLV